MESCSIGSRGFAVQEVADDGSALERQRLLGREVPVRHEQVVGVRLDADLVRQVAAGVGDDVQDPVLFGPRL